MVLARIAIAVPLVVSLTAEADQGSFFFGTENKTSSSRPTAHFNDATRQRLLQIAHACNMAKKSPDEQRQCDEWERQARDSIASLTRQLHRQVEPQRVELQFLYQQQRGW